VFPRPIRENVLTGSLPVVSRVVLMLHLYREDSQ
jgi:hypothetical protein